MPNYQQAGYCELIQKKSTYIAEGLELACLVAQDCEYVAMLGMNCVNKVAHHFQKIGKEKQNYIQIQFLSFKVLIYNLLMTDIKHVSSVWPQ